LILGPAEAPSGELLKLIGIPKDFPASELFRKSGAGEVSYSSRYVMIRFAITPLSVIRSIGPPTINNTRLVIKQE
jgi:hypothetical protein